MGLRQWLCHTAAIAPPSVAMMLSMVGNRLCVPSTITRRRSKSICRAMICWLVATTPERDEAINRDLYRCNGRNAGCPATETLNSSGQQPAYGSALSGRQKPRNPPVQPRPQAWFKIIQCERLTPMLKRPLPANFQIVSSSIRRRGHNVKIIAADFILSGITQASVHIIRLFFTAVTMFQKEFNRVTQLFSEKEFIKIPLTVRCYIRRILSAARNPVPYLSAFSFILAFSTEIHLMSVALFLRVLVSCATAQSTSRNRLKACFSSTLTFSLSGSFADDGQT